MATRFRSDAGLTARMTLTMFLLGALFVGLVVALMVAFRGFAPIIAIVAIGMAIAQWYNSDKLAMKAMRAREVTPQQAPELHAMVDRLCALADMPKPRVGVADTDLPNAFATGRSPDRAVVVVTTGILQRLTVEELEGVMAHELSHVAHRDVLVMTLASSAGIIAGLVTQGMRFGGLHAIGRSRRDGAGAALAIALIASLITYAVSFVLIRLLSRYRELCADRSAAYLTGQPAALASALRKISGDMSTIPQRDLRSVETMNAFFFAPAIRGVDFSQLTSTHPSLEQRLEQLARISADLGRPT